MVLIGPGSYVDGDVDGSRLGTKFNAIRFNAVSISGLIIFQTLQPM